MPIPYTQTSMALVRAVDGTYISYPFVDRGDTNTKVYNLVCTQRASDYNAAQIDLDDNMSSAANAGVIDLPSGWADSNAYFVGDADHSPLPGGMLQFTRTFANIPAYSQTSTGSYGYTFPGLRGFAVTTMEESDVSSVSMTLGTLGVTVVTSDALTLSVGEKIDMLLKYKDAGSDFVYVISGEVFVLSVTNTTTFTADIGRYFDSQTTLTLVSGEVRKPRNENRPPLQQQGQLTDALPSVHFPNNGPIDGYLERPGFDDVKLRGRRQLFPFGNENVAFLQGGLLGEGADVTLSDLFRVLAEQYVYPDCRGEQGVCIFALFDDFGFEFHHALLVLPVFFNYFCAHFEAFNLFPFREK